MSQVSRSDFKTLLGQINVKPLVTHRYPLEQAYEAFDVTRRGEAVKVMIKCMPED